MAYKCKLNNLDLILKEFLFLIFLFKKRKMIKFNFIELAVFLI